MTFTAVTLADPLSGAASALYPRDGVSMQSLDIQPAVREVSEERVGGPGQVDGTRFLTAAAVTVSLILGDPESGLTLEALLDEIGPFLAPAARPSLVCANDQWAQERQLTVRFDSKTAPMTNSQTLPVALSFKAVNGVWEAAALSEATAPAFATASGGWRFTAAGAASTAVAAAAMTAGSSGGEPLVTNPGGLECDFVARLYGPCTGPKLANDTTGQAIEFSDSVVLAAGAYVEISSSKLTALLNSQADSSVLNALNFTTLQWWRLQPGQNQIRYYPSTASGGSAAVIDFRPAWMP